MNTQYLGKYSEKITHLADLVEGNLYVLERGVNEIIAFVMPLRESIDTHDGGTYTFKDIPVVKATVRHCGQEIEDIADGIESKLEIDEHIDMEIRSAVFEPLRESPLRKTIVEKLGIQEDDEEREVA